MNDSSYFITGVYKKADDESFIMFTRYGSYFSSDGNQLQKMNKTIGDIN